MCRSKILSPLAVAAIVLCSITMAPAQSKDASSGRGNWGARALSGSVAITPPQLADNDSTSITTIPIAEEEANEATAKVKGLTGTWRVAIPTSAGGLPPFNAYQTFSSDGTFTEVSDLLTTQTESPAHGVWSGKKNSYQLTFELFVFDPGTKAPAGRVRVRCAITLSPDGETFAADSVVDFITPDGEIIEGVDSGPFSGTRVKVVPISGT